MNKYIYTGCGDEFARELNISINHLKKNTKCEIVVIKSRTNHNINHDNVLSVNVPNEFNDRQAAIFLKTNIHNHIKTSGDKYAYLDTDILAIRKDIDSIFSHEFDIVLFCNDHTNLDTFSSCAVRNGHIVKHLKDTFGVEINKNYIHPNGGLFVFNEKSINFLNKWYENCLKLFENKSIWHIRDQAALVATFFQMGLQNSKRLDGDYNYLTNEKTILNLKNNSANPYFIHFINRMFNNKSCEIWNKYHNE